MARTEVSSSSSSSLDGGQAFRRAVVDFIGGTLGGISTVLIGQPLDTIKVKMQTFPHLYSNFRLCFKETLRNDGIIRGLYAGTAPALVANVAENAVLFGAYGLCQRTVMSLSGKRNVKDLSTVQNALSGGLAAIFSSLTLCPTELIKCKLQALRETTGAKPSTSIVDMCYGIYRTDGVTGFYRGFGPTVAREMPGYFAFFGAYEGSRQCFARYYGCDKSDIGTFGTAISGGIAGICIWLVIFPADLVKSRVQVFDMSHLQDSSYWQVTRSILRTKGIRGLYCGLTPTLIRTFPATAALFLVVELTKKTFG